MSFDFNIPLLLSIFGIVFIAELPDKTALASLVLATRYKPLQVFVGAATALTAQSIIAIAAGSLLSLLPVRYVHIGAGILFIIFAFFMWRRNEEGEEEKLKKEEAKDVSFYRGTWLVFVVVFIAEWGDLTQLATATMAAKYNNPLIVFLGATAALWAVAALAILIGNRAGRLFDANLTKKIAAVIFVLVGLALLFGLL